MHHRAIFEQVSAGSVEGAREAMRAHLIEARQTVLEAAALAAEDETAVSPRTGVFDTQDYAVREKGDRE